MFPSLVYSRHNLWSKGYEVDYDVSQLYLEWTEEERAKKITAPELLSSTSSNTQTRRNYLTKTGKEKKDNKGMKEEERGENLIYMSIASSDKEEERLSYHRTIVNQIITNFNLTVSSSSNHLPAELMGFSELFHRVSCLSVKESEKIFVLLREIEDDQKSIIAINDKLSKHSVKKDDRNGIRTTRMVPVPINFIVINDFEEVLSSSKERQITSQVSEGDVEEDRNRRAGWLKNLNFVFKNSDSFPSLDNLIVLLVVNHKNNNNNNEKEKERLLLELCKAKRRKHLILSQNSIEEEEKEDDKKKNDHNNDDDDNRVICSLPELKESYGLSLDKGFEFNGHAFIGRISRFAVQDSSQPSLTLNTDTNPSPSYSTPYSLCDTINSHFKKNDNDHSEGQGTPSPSPSPSGSEQFMKIEKALLLASSSSFSSSSSAREGASFLTVSSIVVAVVVVIIAMILLHFKQQRKPNPNHRRQIREEEREDQGRRARDGDGERESDGLNVASDDVLISHHTLLLNSSDSSYSPLPNRPNPPNPNPVPHLNNEPVTMTAPRNTSPPHCSSFNDFNFNEQYDNSHLDHNDSMKANNTTETTQTNTNTPKNKKKMDPNHINNSGELPVMSSPLPHLMSSLSLPSPTEMRLRSGKKYVPHTNPNTGESSSGSKTRKEKASRSRSTTIETIEGHPIQPFDFPEATVDRMISRVTRRRKSEGNTKK